MLLRRVMKHFSDQNWFAVGVDLVIVVIGVVLGIEVANWNEVRNNEAGLIASLERLDKEVLQNLAMIDQVLTNFEVSQADLDRGRDALNDCVVSAEGQAALERLLFDFVEDVQPNFVTVALDQLADEGRYQDLLSLQFQADFGLYAGRLKEEDEQLTSHYENMWSHHVSRHPDVSAVFSADAETYEGWRFLLSKPLEELCVDASFRNRFINTLGFYTSINYRLKRFRAEAEQFKASLKRELQHH